MIFDWSCLPQSLSTRSVNTVANNLQTWPPHEEEWNGSSGEASSGPVFNTILPTFDGSCYQTPALLLFHMSLISMNI